MEHEVSHREYYGQFVDARVLDIVKSVRWFKSILESKDEHLNDVPLILWDRLAEGHKAMIGAKVSVAQDRCGYSISNGVCIFKEAAKQLKEAHDAATT
jgi:hypothetical protein